MMNASQKDLPAALILIALLLSACSTTMPPATQEAVYASRGSCHTNALAWAVGQPANEDNGKRLFKESGAGLWRIVTPEQVIQKDRRTDRLTVNVDKANIITSTACQ